MDLFSPICFSSDLFLFGSVNTHTAMAILNIMKDFYDSSGMKVSISKTTIYFSKYVLAYVRREVNDLLRVREINDLRKYLGVLIFHKRINKHTYAYILDRMRSQIARWNVSRISFAGRVTLAQSVLSSMPIYTMQTTKLPIGSCDGMENLVRGFVWDSTKE